MKIAIRADATAELGTGHIFRCLTLADELRGKGAEVYFASRELPESLAAEVKRRGHALLSPAESDLREPGRWDWVIVDHYDLDESWERAVRPWTRRLMVIDDLANRRHNCDVLLDQNFHENPDARYASLVPAGCARLLGPRYALLRPQFHEARQTLRARDGRISRILVSLGGVDVTNETSKVLGAIARLGRDGLEVDVVLGALSPHKSAIRDLAAKHRGVTVHEGVKDMAALMAAADLAVGAGGTSTWERCYLGLPSLTIVVAENQAACTAALAGAGLTRNLGWHADVTVETIAAGIEECAASPERLRAWSERLLELMPPVAGASPAVSAMEALV